MNLTKILELTSLVTVQQMLVRDMFQERLKQEKPIHIHEFLYPLMQGYDSVAMAVDGEVGATDQIFNMLVGRDLSEHLLGKNKIVLATRLIIDSGTGKKMSKSEGTLIAVTDDPQTIREKVLNAIGDEIIQTVFELCTEKEQSWIDQRQADIKAGKNPRVWKEELADELIRMYHGASGVTAARQAKEFSISEPVRIDALLKELEVVSSLSGAKQLIKGNGVRVNDVVITQWDHVVQKGDRVQVGAGKFFLLN